MDLTKQYPRSPYEKLGPYIFLARTLDKSRAYNAATLGEYTYNCSNDVIVFKFLGINHEEFAEAAKERKADEEMLSWVDENAENKHSSEEIEAFNKKFQDRKPDTPEKQEYFNELLMDLAPGRTDIKTWFDLIDADEGRNVVRSDCPFRSSVAA